MSVRDREIISSGDIFYLNIQINRRAGRLHLCQAHYDDITPVNVSSCIGVSYGVDFDTFTIMGRPTDMRSGRRGNRHVSGGNGPPTGYINGCGGCEDFKLLKANGVKRQIRFLLVHAATARDEGAIGIED